MKKYFLQHAVWRCSPETPAAGFLPMVFIPTGIDFSGKLKYLKNQGYFNVFYRGDRR